MILLDVMIPELDGFAVCEILRRHSDTARVPIIMITALSGEMARFTGLGAGACAYINKPFSPRQVISCVEKVLIDHSNKTAYAGTNQS